jgi:hypothetical protein
MPCALAGTEHGPCNAALRARRVVLDGGSADAIAAVCSRHGPRLRDCRLEEVWAMRAIWFLPPAAVLALGACSGHEPTPPPPPSGNAAACAAGSSPATIALPVGGVGILDSPPSLNCVRLSAAGGGAGSFAVIGANASPTPDEVGRYAMVDSTSSATLANLRAPRATVAASRLPGGMSIAGMSIALTGGSAMDGRLRAMERRVLRLNDPRRMQAARSLLSASRVPSRVSAAAVPHVGDTLKYKVPDPNANDACTTFDTVRAVVQTVGTHGIILQDVNAPSGGFTAADFASISDEFDSKIYPTDTIHFGGPSDIDQNGHVLILYTPIVNAATKRGDTGILEGFFFGGDLFPVSNCKQSNEAEIFYLIVPDPAGKFSDVRSVSNVRQDTRGTIAHEFQHMINLGVRIRENAPDEATWLNEALSHFAEELVGRAERGFSDMQPLTIQDVADFSNNLNDFNAFFGQNLARFKLWLLNPGQLGATSTHADTSLAVRGAAWSLVRWSSDQFSGGNVAAFTRALVAGPDTSVANITARAGVPFDTLMAGWLVANVASNDSIAGLPPRYTYLSWNIRSVESAVNNTLYPLAITQLASGQTAMSSTASAAGNYFQLSLSPSGQAIIGMADSTGGPVKFGGARMYVVRTK